MTREPNPYAQQRTYTVTQTMAISVPSVVAEDVLDGEDGGGMSAADSAVLYELQSDMVELKSDVATLETNVNNLTQITIPSISANVGTLETKVSTLIYDTVPSISIDVATLETNVNNLTQITIPSIRSDVTAARQKADLAFQKSQVTWLTTPDYTTSKLQITSGVGLKALSLTTNGGTSTMYDLVMAASNVTLDDPLSSLQFSGSNGSWLLPQVAYNDNPSDLQYCILAVDSIANAEAPACRLRVTTTGGIQTTTTGGRTWVDFTGGGHSDITLSGDLKKVNFSGSQQSNVIDISGNFNGADTELYYYALAASAFANVDYPDCQLKVEGSGLLYTTNGGQTWTAVGDNNSSSDAVLTLSGFAGTYKDYDATVLDYKLGLDLDPSTQQAYLIVKNGAAASWQPLTLGSDSSSGSTVSDSAAKLTGYINGEYNLVTDLDYQLCLGKTTNSNLPYILVSNTAGNSWTTLIEASDREYLDAIRPITRLISDPYGSPIFTGSSQNTYRLIADNADLFGDRYLKLNESKADQLDTSAGSMSLSNMVWLSANASRLAELLPSIHS